MATVEFQSFDLSERLDLRQVADMYEQLMKIKNGCYNRLGAVARDDDETIPDELVASNPLLGRMRDALEECRRLMESKLPENPCYEHLMGIPGINRTCACRIVGLIPMVLGPPVHMDARWNNESKMYEVVENPSSDDLWATSDGVDWFLIGQEDGDGEIPRVRGEAFDQAMIHLGGGGPLDGITFERNFSTFSKLRVFAGKCPGRNKRVKGEKSAYSNRLKTNLYIAFESMLKAYGSRARSKYPPKRWYVEIYYQWRETYKERYGEKKDGKANGWSDLRQHYAAMNKTMDPFLCHIWRIWREQTGWPVRSLYVHERLEHDHNHNAPDFTSPEMAADKMKQHSKR